MKKIVHVKKRKPNSTTAASKADIPFSLIDDFSELMMKSDASHYHFTTVALITQQWRSVVQLCAFYWWEHLFHFQAADKQLPPRFRAK